MKKVIWKRSLSMLLLLVFTILIGFSPTHSVQALVPPCTGSGCNYVDPYNTVCWSTAVIAGSAVASDGITTNRNMYSGTCVANYSYTKYSTYTYLAAETVGVYTYEAPQTYVWVYNNMWDGNGVVCTRGYKGTAPGRL
jgi:hypothetical protein